MAEWLTEEQDLRERKPMLVGQTEQAADAMFGARRDAFSDARTGVKWLIYGTPGETYCESFYLVEVSAEGRITNVRRCKRNADGLEDIIEQRSVADRALGETATACEKMFSLPSPVLTAHSEATDMDVRVYDRRDLTHAAGTHYHVLAFDQDGHCTDVVIIGVTAQ